MKTLAPQLIPTREDLRKRLSGRLGALQSIYSPLTSLMAEEMERIIMELWRANEAVPPPPEKVVTIARKNGATRTQHYCPNCRGVSIRPMHQYCPTCGTKIVWR